MKKMRHSNHGLRIALLAGASVVALAAVAPSAGAADMNKTMPMKAPPAPAPKETWSWWIEGGAMNVAGDAFSIGPVISNIKPKWGWEGAAGFDWVPQGWGPWHLSGQFRYGTAQRTQAFHGSTTLIVPTGTTLIAIASNNEKIRDDHWLVDFAVGRDLGLGNGSNAQWKLGLRVADLRAKLTASGSVATTPGGTGVFSTVQKATFVGAGPRLGVDGSTPLGGGWSIDWLGGVAVLFGERQTTQTTFPTPVGAGVFLPITSASAISDTTAVFNVDGQAGLSYWFSPSFKITASYRVDAYFSALKTVKPGTANGSFNSLDQIYNGPMLRLTSSF
jgi:Legionella pneumophila major outer membrane protein precursor